MSFHQDVLANGLEVVAETRSSAVSTAIGFFVRTGARDESPQVAGVSHFLEHMAFKGNDGRSAEAVNREFDRIGAKYNAYTSEEHTVFHAAVLPDYLAPTIDLLGDLLRPSLRQDDFDMEKKVILEEIGMYADLPLWNAYERAMRLHFSDHPLGNSILGTTGTVGDLTSQAMREYHANRYCPSNIFVAACGKLDWDHFFALVDEKCGAWEPSQTSRTVTREHRRDPSTVVQDDRFVQECLFLVSEGPAADSPLRMAADLLATIIGDDTGSRLYWALVEPGKVDSVDFSYSEYEGVGVFLTSISCQPELAEENLATLRRVFEEVTRDGVTDEEIEQAKNKLGSRAVLAAERPRNRLSSLGYNWSYRREYRTLARELSELLAITPAQIRAVLEECPLTDATTVCLGPLESSPGLQ